MNNAVAQVATRGAKAVAARSLVEAAHETIRQEILTGALPPETKLRFEMLRERYGFGASTLREALTRLVGEALVTSEEQKGFRVASVSLEDLADLTRTRIFVEREALRESILSGDALWKNRVTAAYQRLSETEAELTAGSTFQADVFEERNREFHQALVSACASRWLNRLYGILFQQAERYRRISLVNCTVSRDVHGEHAAIFEAALGRDADRACKLASAHIQQTLANLANILAKQQ